MADYSELKRKAQEVRNEVKAGANTATRVGTVLEGIVDALEAQANQDANIQESIEELQDNTSEELKNLVVNDLTTGGADKALSAEMGKELVKELTELGSEVDALEFEINGVDYSQSIDSDGYILGNIFFKEGITYKLISDVTTADFRTYNLDGEIVDLINESIYPNKTFVAIRDAVRFRVYMSSGGTFSIKSQSDSLINKINTLNETVEKNKQITDLEIEKTNDIAAITNEIINGFSDEKTALEASYVYFDYDFIKGRNYYLNCTTNLSDLRTFDGEGNQLEMIDNGIFRKKVFVPSKSAKRIRVYIVGNGTVTLRSEEGLLDNIEHIYNKFDKNIISEKIENNNKFVIYPFVWEKGDYEADIITNGGNVSIISCNASGDDYEVLYNGRVEKHITFTCKISAAQYVKVMFSSGNGEFCIYKSGTVDGQIVSLKSRVKALEDKGSESEKTLVAVGDSITQGAGASSGGKDYVYKLWTMLSESGLVNAYNNLGSGGKTSTQIAAYVGAYPLFVTGDTVIPSSTTAVKISLNEIISDPTGSCAYCNPCYINGVEGDIVYEGSGKTYNFNRKTDGVEKRVYANTQIITNAAKAVVQSEIMVIFVGSNDNSTTNDGDDVIFENVRKIASKSKNGKFIIASPYEGSTTENLRNLLHNEFGQKFIDMYHYFTKMSVYDAIEKGLIDGGEPSEWKTLFFVDNIHPNDIGHRLIAELFYNRIIELFHL